MSAMTELFWMLNTMTIQITNEPVPLAMYANGMVRVGGTRITLDTVIAAFNEGATAEDIVADYPVLNLADVYAVISFYLHKRAEVDAYLSQRGQQARQTRQENEARFGPHRIRERLPARHADRLHHQRYCTAKEM